MKHQKLSLKKTLSKKNLKPFISLLSLVLAFSVVWAASTDNLAGWLWSDNVGWISMNDRNCDTDGNGFIDEGLCGGDDETTTSYSYGVSLATSTGVFSGYAWGDGVGWIKFNPSGPYPEAPEHGAQLSGNIVTGWVRACAGTVDGNCDSATGGDGWDGWIKMSGMTTGSNPRPYGVSITNNNFSGYAWGSDVIGWLDLSSVVFNTTGNYSEDNPNGGNSAISITINPSTTQSINIGDTVNFSSLATTENDDMVEHRFDMYNSNYVNPADGSHWIYDMTEQLPFTPTGNHNLVYAFNPTLAGTYIVKASAKDIANSWVDSTWVTVNVEGTSFSPGTSTTYTTPQVSSVVFSGTPASISKGGATALSWDIVNPNTYCKISANAIAGIPNPDLASLNTLLSSATTRTDSNDPSGSNRLMTNALTSQASGTSHARGKKTISGINYPVEFTLQCENPANAKKVRVNITSSVEG